MIINHIQVKKGGLWLPPITLSTLGVCFCEYVAVYGHVLWYMYFSIAV